MSSAAYLSQNPSLCRAEIEKKPAEEIVILHQLLPRNRWHVPPGSSAGQRYVHLYSVPGYPGSAWGDIIQAFLIVARRYVVNSLRDTSAGLFGRRVRIIRAL